MSIETPIESSTNYWENDEYQVYINERSEAMSNVFIINKLEYKVFALNPSFATEGFIKTQVSLKNCFILLDDTYLFQIQRKMFVPIYDLSPKEKRTLDRFTNEDVDVQTFRGVPLYMVDDRSFEYDINYEAAQPVIDEVNEALHQKCPSLHLEFNTNLDTLGRVPVLVNDYDEPILLTLCLFNKANCISSIIFDLRKETDGHYELEINSKTEPLFEGNKYNIFLRGVSILIAPHFTTKEQNEEDDAVSIDYIISRGVNPASVYVLQKYFNATAQDQFHHDIDQATLTSDYLKAYFEGPRLIEAEPQTIYLRIKLTQSNVDIAKRVVDGLLSEISGFRCPSQATKKRRLGGRRKKRKTSKTPI
jgi:hypothetical protein